MKIRRDEPAALRVGGHFVSLDVEFNQAIFYGLFLALGSAYLATTVVSVAESARMRQ